MLNLFLKYKECYIDSIINTFSVPLLFMTIYSILPIYFSFTINVFYSTTYLLFDVFSTKSIHSVYYLQTLLLLHFYFRYFLSIKSNILIHIFSWILQFINNKSPPLLYNSFLFIPYFTYLETFYPSSFTTNTKDKYKIIKNDYDISKKSIIYFAGLFQNAQLEYKDISNNLSSYNHIYINTYFNNNDIYKDTLIKIIDELGELDIECIIGYSFGGSLSLQFKEIYLQKKK